MLSHGKKFNYKDKSLVLLLDRVLLSLDDKADDDFVIDSIFDKNIDKTLYFVAKFSNYNEFKKDYQKEKISGFWHSLFINDKVNLAANSKYQLRTDDVVYTISYSAKKGITTNFQLLSQLNKAINYEQIDTDITNFIQIVSPAEKAQNARLNRIYTMSSISAFWVFFALAVYFYIDKNKKQEFNTSRQILSVKTKIALADNKIISQKQKIYVVNKTVAANVKALLFLQFKSIELVGEVLMNDQHLKMKSSSDLKLLKAFVKQNKQYKLTRHPESLPTLEIRHD